MEEGSDSPNQGKGNGPVNQLLNELAGASKSAMHGHLSCIEFYWLQRKKISYLFRTAFENSCRKSAISLACFPCTRSITIRSSGVE